MLVDWDTKVNQRLNCFCLMDIDSRKKLVIICTERMNRTSKRISTLMTFLFFMEYTLR